MVVVGWWWLTWIETLFLNLGLIRGLIGSDAGHFETRWYKVVRACEIKGSHSLYIYIYNYFIQLSKILSNFR